MSDTVALGDHKHINSSLLCLKPTHTVLLPEILTGEPNVD